MKCRHRHSKKLNYCTIWCLKCGAYCVVGRFRVISGGGVRPRRNIWVLPKNSKLGEKK